MTTDIEQGAPLDMSDAVYRMIFDHVRTLVGRGTPRVSWTSLHGAYDGRTSEVRICLENPSGARQIFHVTATLQEYP